jgi:hypothetical protein
MKIEDLYFRMKISDAVFSGICFGSCVISLKYGLTISVFPIMLFIFTTSLSILFMKSRASQIKFMNLLIRFKSDPLMRWWHVMLYASFAKCIAVYHYTETSTGGALTRLTWKEVETELMNSMSTD